MDIYGEKVNRLIGELGRLPGIGGKTAQRLAFHIIDMPQERVEKLAETMVSARTRAVIFFMVFFSFDK